VRHRTALLEVERFARRSVGCIVDEHDTADVPRGGHRLGHRASNGSGADDRDSAHRRRLVTFERRGVGVRVLYKDAVSLEVPLSGKIAFVTGGSRGIGLATARALLAEGARVVITATSDDTLRTAAAQLGDASGAANLLTLRADVRREDEVTGALASAARHFGGIDLLVNNAGLGLFRAVAEMTSQEWRDVVDTNLTGVFHCCRAVLPYMRARGGGWIVNVSSLSATHSFANGAAYCASKAGLIAFSESLMQEVRHDGIRVSCVLPGSVRTGFMGGSGSEGDWKLAPEDVAHVVVDLMRYPARSLPSRVEIRPSQPPRKG
jgi:NAD(P)-dependent dehydrogenase (short-subunit alcohol dehydrogenase family)